MARKIPSLFGLALANLITAHGWTAKELASKAGMAPSTLSGYLTGDQPLPRERLDSLAALMGLGPEKVVLAIVAAGLVHPVPPPPVSPVDPDEEERRIIDLAVALGLEEVVDVLRSFLLQKVRAERARLALEEADTLLVRLRPYSAAERRVLVEGGTEYHTWGLCVRLCDESERVAPHSAKAALEWAELARLMARRVPGTDAWRSYLEGYAEPFLGNALRVGGELRPAEAAFDRGSRFRKAGSAEAGLLDESRLFDLEASLRRAQGRFPEALRLHDRALEVAPPDQKAAILLSKSATLEEKGDYEASIEVLDQAARLIDGQRQPRLLCILRFNKAACLCRLGCAKEAEPIVAEVRNLAERLRNDLDLVRTLWLEGLVHAGLGRMEQAVAALEQVRRDFAARLIPYDFAVASLDLALLYREQGRSAEVLELADEMLRIFEAADVHRESLAAVLLFRDAARKGAVTSGLVRHLQEFLKKARTNPKLRFEI